MPEFCFTDRDVASQEGGERLVITIEGITNRSSLFLALSTQLQFPDYFGENWDALSDCLRDLSWLESRIIVLVHAELPTTLGHDDLGTYVRLLDHCMRDWKQGEDHELMVVFPVDAQGTVERFLST